MLKIALRKIAQPKSWVPNLVVNWRNLWKIKNPTLRATRYKLAHGDIYSNSRRYKCKLVANDSCTVCGMTETRVHQLFECRNASRLWVMAEEITGVKFQSIHDIIKVTNSTAAEILISVIAKALIQIDRSVNINNKAILTIASNYLRIEWTVTKCPTIEELMGRIQEHI